MNKFLCFPLLFLCVYQHMLAQESFIFRTCQTYLTNESVSYICMNKDSLDEMVRTETAESEKEFIQIISQLSELSIFKSNASDSTLNALIYMEVISAAKHDGYGLISRIEDENITTQYLRKNGEKKKNTQEILMISKAPDGCLVISAVGEQININQLAKLSRR